MFSTIILLKTMGPETYNWLYVQDISPYNRRIGVFPSGGLVVSSKIK